MGFEQSMEEKRHGDQYGDRLHNISLCGRPVLGRVASLARPFLHPSVRLLRAGF